MNAYHYIKKLLSKPKAFKPHSEALIGLRSETSVLRLEKPSNPGRARTLGYKAKEGYVIIRVKIRKGGRKKRQLHGHARKPSKTGQRGFTTKQSLQLIAEQRAFKKFPNLEVLNSYWVGEDGISKWFEVIMVNPESVNIKKSIQLRNLVVKKKRVLRGLTSQGRKMRGLTRN